MTDPSLEGPKAGEERTSKVVLTVLAGPHKGRTFTFEEHSTFLVGRGNQAHFQLPTYGDPDKDRYISRVHFLVEVNPPLCRLLDVSSNKTYVNGSEVTDTELRDGDIISIGKETFIGVAIQWEEPENGASTLSHLNRANPGQAPEPATPLETLLPEKFDLGPLPPPAPSLLPADYLQRIQSQAQTVPGYWLVQEIGRGGMGVVYQAICEAGRNVVALKALTPKVRTPSADLQRFLREASILRELDHPHIVAFRDMGQAGGRPYFAMDYVQGADAARLVKQGGPLDIPRAVRLTCQLLQALEYAHGRGFVHRDIKPANLLVVQDKGREIAKLADFGLARAYQASRISGLTVIGDVGGTTKFMPPEQITDFRECQPPSDQYAAAATLYHLLTGRFIHDFPRDVAGQFHKILHDPPVPIEVRRADVPTRLAAVIHRGLAHKATHRYADVSEMRAALLEFL